MRRLQSCGGFGSFLLIALLSQPAQSGDGYIFTEFNYPGALDTTIQDINDQGDIVGEFGDIDTGRRANPGMQGYVRRGTNLQVISFPGATQTSAIGINNAGMVVGEYGDATGAAHGFVFDGTNYRSLDYPGATNSSLSDINGAGLMVGTYQDGFGLLHGFTSDGNTFTSYDASFDFQLLPIATTLQGINDSGTRVGTSTFFNDNFEDEVVGYSYPPLTAVRTTESIAPQHLGVAGTFAEGVNNQGQIVGRYVAVVGGVVGQSADVEFRGFVYDPELDTYTDIDLPGGGCTFQLVSGEEEVPGKCVRSLQGINDDGSLVGYFDRNDGQLHGVIATLGLPGDFDRDGNLSAADIDVLTVAILASSTDVEFDLNSDGMVSDVDRDHWISELKRTYKGDANLDGLFDTGDLVVVFQQGEYEDQTPQNSAWSDGDWNGDQEFGTADLIAAFQQGGFEQGPRAALPVPESVSLNVVWLSIMLVTARAYLTLGARTSISS